MKISELSKTSHENAKEKGFWDTEKNIIDKLALKQPLEFEEIKAIMQAFKCQRLLLVVSELGEAVEALRKENDENFYEELADTEIRLGDFYGGYNINITEAIMKKQKKNKERQKLHGKKF